MCADCADGVEVDASQSPIGSPAKRKMERKKRETTKRYVFVPKLQQHCIE